MAVIIPALNEAGNISQLVQETFEQSVHRVIVVDNGSTDDTALLAGQMGATVVSETRQGYGYACAAGTAYFNDKLAAKAPLPLRN